MVQGKSVILIVEDDPGVTVLEQRRLERAGYGVVTAMTAEEALGALKRATVDLILLDFRLAGNVDGLDFYSQVKNAGFDVPVILVTGYSNEATVIRALRIGVRGRRGNGEYFPVEASMSFADVNGQKFATIIARDVTERKKTEQALRDSETRFKAFMDNSPTICFVKDEDGRCVYINQQVE